MKLIKRFLNYYKPHMNLFLLDLACAFGIACLDLTFPMFSRKILNVYIPDKNLQSIIYVAIIMIILYILRAFLNYIVAYWGHIVGVRMEYDMRKELFEHLQIMDVSFFDNRRTGKLMSRLVNDLNLVSELAHHGPEDLFLSIVMLIGSFIILANINLKLTLIVFAAVPFMLFFGINKSIKMRSKFRRVREKVADVNAKIENSLSGVRVAKSFTNEDFEIEKFSEGNTMFRNAKVGAYKAMAEFFTGIKFAMNILNVITITAGSYFVYIGQITYGDIVAYLLYVNFFMEPIRRLMNFAEQFQNGMSGFERFSELMDIDPNIKNSQNATDLKDVKGDINIENVTFSYNEIKENYENNEKSKSKILSDINLFVKSGKTLALVGPSGGGKTTLCHLIPRFYDVTSGKISIDNINIKDIKINSLRKNIGLVQQDVFLFTGTIGDNILYGNIEATEDEMIAAAKNASIHDYIMTLPNGYDTFIGERGIKLSGGQKQRISIARVFLKNPPILILDEATSALDNATEIMIQQSLEKLSKGRTTIVIAHRLSTIKNADEIVVITDKGIQERGTHKTLINNNGIYSNLYESQFANL